MAELDPLTGLPKTNRNQNVGLGGVGGSLLFGGTAWGGYNPFQAAPGTTAGRAPTTGGASGGSTTPGLGFDYKSLILNDPLFSQFRADLASQGVADAATRRAQLNKALIAFGEVPGASDLSKALGYDVAGDIDPTTTALAQKNTEAGLSISARLAKAHADNIRAVKNALAARGALRSGELGHQLNEEQLQFTQGQYDSRQQLMDYLAGVQAAFLQGERQRKGSEYDQMLATLTRLLSQGIGVGGGGGAAQNREGGALPEAQQTPWTAEKEAQDKVNWANYQATPAPRNQRQLEIRSSMGVPL